jgi:hypothetical protein
MGLIVYGSVLRLVDKASELSLKHFREPPDPSKSDTRLKRGTEAAEMDLAHAQ